MKTFEQWRKEYPGTLFHEYSRQMVNEIQLDAAKWGMEQAAKVAEKTFCREASRIPLIIHDKIQNFANNLTIDQLPK